MKKFLLGVLGTVIMNISKSDSLKVEIKHDKGKASEIFLLEKELE